MEGMRGESEEMKMDLLERCSPGCLSVRQTGAPRAGTPGVLWKRVYPAIYRYRDRYRKIMAFGHEIQKNHLDRISAMLTRLGGRGYPIHEDRLLSNWERIDSDSEKNESRKEIRGELG